MDRDYRNIERRLRQDSGDVAAGYELLAILHRNQALGPLHSAAVFRELEQYFGSEVTQAMLIDYGEQLRAKMHQLLEMRAQPLIDGLTEIFRQRGWFGRDTEMWGIGFIEGNDQVIINNPCPHCGGTAHRFYCERCEVEPPCAHYNQQGLDEWGMQPRCGQCYQGQVVQTSFSIFSGNSFSRFVWVRVTPPEVSYQYGCNILLESMPRGKGHTLHGFLNHRFGAGITGRLPVTLENLEVTVDELHQRLRQISDDTTA